MLCESFVRSIVGLSKVMAPFEFKSMRLTYNSMIIEMKIVIMKMATSDYKYSMKALLKSCDPIFKSSFQLQICMT